MKNIWKGICLLAGVVLMAPPALAQPSTQPTWVADKRFNAIFDMYWRARLLSEYAGNRICALKGRPSYDDPKSPFRPLSERLRAVSMRIETAYPKALNTVVRPYRMPPPQMNCDDENSAWEAIFGFETAVTAVERLLDELESRRASGAMDDR